jgi:hypothetical protein
MLRLFTKEWEQSRQDLEEAGTTWQKAGDAWGMAYTSLYRGAMEVLQGHYEEAMRLLDSKRGSGRRHSRRPWRRVALCPSRSWLH